MHLISANRIVTGLYLDRRQKTIYGWPIIIRITPKKKTEQRPPSPRPSSAAIWHEKPAAFLFLFGHRRAHRLTDSGVKQRNTFRRSHDYVDVANVFRSGVGSCFMQRRRCGFGRPPSNHRSVRVDFVRPVAFRFVCFFSFFFSPSFFLCFFSCSLLASASLFRFPSTSDAYFVVFYEHPSRVSFPVHRIRTAIHVSFRLKRTNRFFSWFFLQSRFNRSFFFILSALHSPAS